eukprot:CAMPEP_0185851672 /NCGR_PEP_ID=MMETSP1354-20130828/10978_1 /TAXON_ID=708628 /ORGANISM="Erythrolobus madagascarensis, Strain CCMP3276" /LENGTH=51 /DNA_ID=CAMNT_0028552707 /DNA_START=48 /DNA_END=200 /DNA_ORIENTATION=+
MKYTVSYMRSCTPSGSARSGKYDQADGSTPQSCSVLFFRSSFSPAPSAATF